MSKAHETLISDASCFIILDNIGELDLLRYTFQKITTTREIALEFGSQLPEWVEVRSASDQHYQQILMTQIDAGEASAIALAIEIPDCLIILDDYKARKVAENLGLEITGTIGVMIKAKLKGVITSIKPLLERLKSTNFRVSEELISRAYEEAKEPR